MRISDWSSDVCSSDLFADGALIVGDAPMKVGKVILAMGAHAAVPPIPGMDSVPYLTSTSALALDRLPKSLLVIGGGVIGVELGQMFSRLGVDVTIRSEEHTSELQSLMRISYAVYCLKKKKRRTIIKNKTKL